VLLEMKGSIIMLLGKNDMWNLRITDTFGNAIPVEVLNGKFCKCSDD